MLKQQASWAYAALNAYIIVSDSKDSDDEQLITDLLTDIQHAYPHINIVTLATDAECRYNQESMKDEN